MGSIPTSDFDTIIFDLGNVLIKMPPQAPEATETSSIPTLRRLVSTSTWMRYECGELDETQCYEMLGKKFGPPPSAIAKVISEARDTFEYDTAIISWIRQLMDETHGSLKFIAVWRIPIPEHTVLYKRWGDELSSIFDEVFTSSAIGIRQPDLGFYRYVLKATRRDPGKTILIDSDTTWNYYIEQPSFTNMNPPNDLDTTSLALQVMPPDNDTITSMLDNMLKYINPDGIPYVNHPRKFPKKAPETKTDHYILQVYYDRTRPRIDPIVCLNILTTFHKYQRGDQLSQARNWIWNMLLHRAYLHGTYYYRCVEWFFFWVYRLIKDATYYPHIQEQFTSLLKQRVQERIGMPGDALALAMRLMVCSFVGVRNYQDMQRLKELQCEDGGWERGYLYSIPIVGKDVFDRGFTTALAMQAVREERQLNDLNSPPHSGRKKRHTKSAKIETFFKTLLFQN
ncbi:hypothetical protein BHYA_0021g00570 [Botrytis hyacinthi]|uniref:HAD-like protein n=1 Tax=Botrytis hyacinthi TaxID=278943 RepID=A0A4Z1GY66_9HELO|nr:hypothetical protein BHYA_0021g00570 [Botrytis hyacinthi]